MLYVCMFLLERDSFKKPLINVSNCPGFFGLVCIIEKYKSRGRKKISSSWEETEYLPNMKTFLIIVIYHYCVVLSNVNADKLEIIM